ncbi:MAG: nitrilotriacetate monooxygenase, partial [Citricoccus sp.]|nr:nitrilotriacetate monooxygenase [Citricoccus sp. WCRC_4]
MPRTQMHLATIVSNGLGASPYAWLQPQVDPADYANIHALVRYAQAAERGKLDFIFLGDFLAQSQRTEAHAPGQTLEPTVVATAITLATKRIGVV